MTALGKLLRTTAFRLALAYLVVFATLSVVVLAYVSWHANALIAAQLNATVNAEITGLAEQYRQGGIRKLVATVEERSNRGAGTLYLLTTFAGDVLAGNVVGLPDAALAEQGERELPYQRAGETAVAPYPAVVRVFVLPGGYRLLVGRDTEERERLSGVIANAVQWSLALVIVLGLAGGVFVARRVLNRIDAMTDTVRGIMAGDLSGRLAVTGSDDEFDRLAQATNAMLDRINELMAGLKEVSDNIAHDLKTPLNRLRNRAEAALRDARSEDDWAGAMERVIADTDAMLGIFNALLLIARAESGGARDQLAAVDLADIAGSVAELYEPLAEERGVALLVETPEPIQALGNRELIGQAVANLIENALNYGGSNGEVRVTAHGDGDLARIVVADRGPGIPDADKARAVERFVRLDTSRSRPGSGLGLALVSAVARLHGGALTLADNEPGLRAVLTLPIQTQALPPPAPPVLPAPAANAGAQAAE
ncbi:signal transduction histidine kinase [Methylopila capsulata]|uniref:histidine kinase n=1 Tax=Methylopila capsulata TaxID=61654 RepID=A0A9W6MS13_9HYPH|nr:ATP-binding protein [Methylopila capsulata]MBM7852084.1 signal transduction histidine kinase [Methylopila capsulata]GLK56290.1 two-component sensor histidine kinase [Methylopila capsulata]